MMIPRTFFFIPVEAGAMPTHLVRHGGTSADCADFEVCSVIFGLMNWSELKLLPHYL